MSIYNVDFNQCARELYPIDKRKTVLLKKIYSLLKPLNDANLFFQFFREGGTFSDYDAGTVYTFGQYIQYQRRIYLRNEVTTDYVAGISPLNTTYWTKILESFIGANERAKFGPGKLVLEYALNKIFGAVFRQPADGTSDIYIENLNTTDDLFFVGEDDESTAEVSEFDQDAIFFVPEVEAVEDSDYAIYVPVAVWTALAPTSIERDAIITSVANKYRLVGYTFEIITY